MILISCCVGRLCKGVGKVSKDFKVKSGLKIKKSPKLDSIHLCIGN